MSNDIIIKVETDYILEANDSISSDYPIQIDYGDGTPLETYANNRIEHTYATTDEYIIRIKRVQHVGDDFLYDSDLANAVKEITIPHQITTIGNNFGACPNLTKINLPNSLTSVGDWFLIGCENLTHVDLPNTLTEIGTNFLFDSGITNITIPKGMKKTPDNFCAMCLDLASININEGLEEIGNGFCTNSEQLINISIPSTVKKIGNFFLTDIPSGYHFSLEEITFHSETPPTVLDDLNYWLRSGYIITFKVPQGTSDIYGHAQNYPDIDEYQIYEEYPTLKASIQALDTRIRNNLRTKGVQPNNNDGLTTLINRIDDIDDGKNHDFLANIGFYDEDNWGGVPPTILKDRLIFSDNTAFPFDNLSFPNTFTWNFIIHIKHPQDTITCGGRLEGASVSINDKIDYELLISITRHDGEEYRVICETTSDEFGITDLTQEELLIEPYDPNDPIVITDIYFSEEYEDNDYEKIYYNMVWDYTSTNNSSLEFPVLLLKNDKPYYEYLITEESYRLDITDGLAIPLYYDDTTNGCWGVYHYKRTDDTNIYSWTNPKQYGLKAYSNDHYSTINYYNNEGNSTDYYANGQAEGYDEFENNPFTINAKVPSEFGMSFEYIADENESDGKGFKIKIYEMITIYFQYLNGNFVFTSSDTSGVLATLNIPHSNHMYFTIHRYADGIKPVYTVTANNTSETVTLNVTILPIPRIQDVQFEENCEIRKFYYWNINEVQS